MKHQVPPKIVFKQVLIGDSNGIIGLSVSGEVYIWLAQGNSNEGYGWIKLDKIFGENYERI